MGHTIHRTYTINHKHKKSLLTETFLFITILVYLIFSSEYRPRVWSTFDLTSSKARFSLASNSALIKRLKCACIAAIGIGATALKCIEYHLMLFQAGNTIVITHITISFLYRVYCFAKLLKIFHRNFHRFIARCIRDNFMKIFICFFRMTYLHFNESLL